MISIHSVPLCTSNSLSTPVNAIATSSSFDYLDHFLTTTFHISSDSSFEHVYKTK